MLPFIRINRIIRDIPSQNIIGGNTHVSLRQLLDKALSKIGSKCVCVRCREVKDADISLIEQNNIVLRIREFNGYGGVEYFISIETIDESIIFG